MIIHKQHGMHLRQNSVSSQLAAILNQIRPILAIFDLQVSQMLPTKFRVKWPFGSGEETKNRFSRLPPWQPSWISDRNDFSYFWSTSHPMLPTKFWVNWPFGSGEEVKDGFSRCPPWRPSWISDRNNFSYFWSTSHPDASYQVSSQLALWFRRRSEKYIFKMAAIWLHGRHLRFSIGMILSYVWSTHHPNASYQVTSPLAQRCRL